MEKEELKQENFGEIVKITWDEYYGDKWDRALKDAEISDETKRVRQKELDAKVKSRLVTLFTCEPLCSAQRNNYNPKPGYSRSHIFSILADYYFFGNNFAINMYVPARALVIKPDFDANDCHFHLEKNISDIMDNIQIAHWEKRKGYDVLIKNLKSYAHEHFEEYGDNEVFFLAIILMILWFCSHDILSMRFDENFRGNGIQIKKAPVICHLYNLLSQSTISKLEDFIEFCGILDLELVDVIEKQGKEVARKLVLNKLTYTEENAKVWDNLVKKYFKTHSNKLLRPCDMQ